jgi:hypothetical protein
MTQRDDLFDLMEFESKSLDTNLSCSVVKTHVLIESNMPAVVETPSTARWYCTHDGMFQCGEYFIQKAGPTTRGILGV